MNGHRITNAYPSFPPADRLRNALFGAQVETYYQYLRYSSVRSCRFKNMPRLSLNRTRMFLCHPPRGPVPSRVRCRRRGRRLADPSSAIFLSHRPSQTNSRPTQCRTPLTRAARVPMVTTHGWIVRLMSPHESLRMRSLVSTFHLRPDTAKARLTSSPPSLPLTQRKRLPPKRLQKSWPGSKRSTPEHRPALHWPCPSRQTVPCRAASPPCLCCVGPWSAAPCSRVRRRRVGAAVRDGRSGTCVASRVALLTVRRKVTRKEAPPVHTHARHTQPRALSHCAPAHIGVARTRLCAVSLRWRARARSTRWVGFFRRRQLGRDLQRRRRRKRRIPRPGNGQSRTCGARG